MTLPQRSFLVDTNTFIQPYNSYYAFDLCPGYWEFLLTTNRHGDLASIDRVKEEILAQEDDLAQWVRTTAPGELFLPTTDPKVTSANRDIMQWVVDNYSSSEARRFAAGADSWLVAYARAYDMVVVTQEFPRKKGKVPLPDVCDYFQVASETLFDMLRLIGAEFVWRRPTT